MVKAEKLMRRKLVNFAIFVPRITNGSDIFDKSMMRLYHQLKEFGFRETPWQFVFDGQIGGVVLPHDSGKNEIHVRFYHDRIFAEFEIGRSYPSHFVGPRWNANLRLLEMLSSEIEKEELQPLSDFMDPLNYREDEAEMTEWNGEDCFVQLREQQKVKKFGFLLSAVHNLGWKSVVGAVGLIVAALGSFSPFVTFLVLLSILASWFMLPSRGQP